MTKQHTHSYQTFDANGNPEKAKAAKPRAKRTPTQALKERTRKAIAKPAIPAEESDPAQESHIAKMAQLAERKAESERIEEDQKKPINWRGSKPREMTAEDIAKIEPDEDAQLSKANAWVLTKARGWLLDERQATPNTHGDLKMNAALTEAATVIGLALQAGNAHDAGKPKGPQKPWSDDYRQAFLDLLNVLKKAHNIEPTNCMTRQFNAALAQCQQVLNRALREGYRGR